MKSTQNHLSSTQSFGEIKSTNYRPTMRSSAAFPLIHKPGRISSIYTFMGYWLRKRNIPLVTALLTIRNEAGEKVNIQSIEVTKTQSYEISSFNIVEKPNEDFTGSIEIEIFSAVDMVFPYPAITFALKGLHGLTFVHTCGRIFNDFEDLKTNNEQEVAETGFDLYIGKDYAPFFSFVNGPVAIKKKEIELEYISQNNERVIKNVQLKNVSPYGLVWFSLNLDRDAQNNDGLIKMCVKIRHDFEGFFPRFVAGNFFKDFEDISITHSYYDTSTDKSNDAIWKNTSVEKFEDGFLAIPFDTDFSAIELAVYPNSAYSPVPVDLKFELFNSNGEFISHKSSKVKIGSKADRLYYINLLDLFKGHSGSLSYGMVRLICDGNGSVPARMKFGLNFSNAVQKKNLSSNICVNAELPNQKILEKPGTFRWCPIFDAQAQKIFLHNTSFVKNEFREAHIDVEVCRSQDDKKLQWKITIPYNGTAEVLKGSNNLIEKFLNGSIGWVSFSCTSPFLFGYYITDYKKGVVGADHLF